MDLLSRIADMLTGRKSEPAAEPFVGAAWGGGGGESYRAGPTYNVARNPHSDHPSAPDVGTPLIGYSAPLPPLAPVAAYQFDPQPGAPRDMPEAGPTLDDLLQGDSGVYPGYGALVRVFDHTTLLNGWEGAGYFNAQSDPDSGADDVNTT